MKRLPVLTRVSQSPSGKAFRSFHIESISAPFLSERQRQRQIASSIMIEEQNLLMNSDKSNRNGNISLLATSVVEINY
jgi:hypothetical protein